VKLTVEDHPYLYEDLRRHEIIDGDHFVQHAPSPRHQLIIGNLLGMTRALPGQTFTYVGVVMSEFDFVLPDFLYITPARCDSILEDKYVRCAPDLVAEVVMEETRRTDEIIKRKAYERCGVMEYWVVDPVVETIKIFRNVHGVYRRMSEMTTETGGVISSPLFADVTLDIADIFDTPH